MEDFKPFIVDNPEQNYLEIHIPFDDTKTGKIVATVGLARDGNPKEVWHNIAKGDLIMVEICQGCYLTHNEGIINFSVGQYTISHKYENIKSFFEDLLAA